MRQIVLMYHDVYNESPQESGFDSNGANKYKMKIDLFEMHLKTLVKLIHNGRIKKDDVILTFDDGGVSFYKIIAPLLDKYGFVGHFYISTNYVGSDAFLSEKEIFDLSNKGHVIGSHSCSHPDNMASISKEKRLEEWKSSISRLNSIIGMKIKEVSIPNGYFSKEDVSMFKLLGISSIYTSKIGELVECDGIMIKGRISMMGNTSPSIIEKIINNRFYIFKLRTQQYFLSIIKKILGNNYLVLKRFIRQWV